mgnify:CR=1 FL=1
MYPLFKMITLWILWKKFQKQFKFIFVSFILVGTILFVSEDIYNAIKLIDKTLLVWFVIFKMTIILAIVFINYYLFKKVKIDKKSYKQGDKSSDFDNYPDLSKAILKKDKLISRTDFILQKYMKNN